MAIEECQNWVESNSCGERKAPPSDFALQSWNKGNTRERCIVKRKCAETLETAVITEDGAFTTPQRSSEQETAGAQKRLCPEDEEGEEGRDIFVLLTDLLNTCKQRKSFYRLVI